MEEENKDKTQTPEQKEESLKEVMKSLRDMVAEQQKQPDKKKSWKLPFMQRFMGKRKLKKGFTRIIYIGHNKNLEFMKVPIEEGSIKAKNNFHEATAEYLMTYKNKPIMIVNAGSEKPYSPNEHLKKAYENGTGTEGQQYIFNRMKKDAYQEVKKKGGGGLMLIIGLIVLGVIAYLVFKGGIPKLI